MLVFRITMHLEQLINLGLGVVLLGLALWAFVSAVTASDDAYRAAFKRTKQFWALVTGAALLGAVISILGALHNGSSGLFIQLLSASAAGVFLADVRPAVRVRK